jgi:hypothetical protein
MTEQGTGRGKDLSNATSKVVAEYFAPNERDRLISAIDRFCSITTMD